MDQQQINQALAVANNYLATDRPNETVELLGVIKRLDPDNENLSYLQNYIISVMQGMKPFSSDFYGKCWTGESLDGQSIEIFCDQGIGDTIQMLRYVKELKSRWNCKTVLNCYAHYENFVEIVADMEFVDEFVKFHFPCDYQTNIMSLPYHIYGIETEFFYPIQFKLINEYPIPEAPFINPSDPYMDPEPEGIKIGLAWRSNGKNKQLCQDKSMQLSDLLWLKEYGELYSLVPDEDIGESFPLYNLSDTVALISHMDIVVSVDTAVLHLAGSMGVSAYGLLHFNADPRWDAKWYDSVTLLRQEKEEDWSVPLEKLRVICNNIFLNNN
jgi:hypothetical protein